MFNQEWETIIGLEVHAQLKTNTKIFSGAPILFGEAPNTQACAIDLGLPGVLPVLNGATVVMAVKLGLAINATIEKKSVFDRKNYFYPDLPKGYQISQFYHPIIKNGYLDINLNEGKQKRINITRAHLEEDAGKSLHEDFHGLTGVDLNRAGTPLLEIVSEPDMRSAEEAISYLKTLHSLVKYLDICDGNMQEGSFRCDANVSVRRMGSQAFGTRVEIKNLNSFKFIEKAINYEVERQIEAISNGQQILQETRLYDVTNNVTRSMRSKEEANDYRYFPDPDLLPVFIDDQFIADIKANMPELAAAKALRFVAEYGLSEYEASILTSSRDLSVFFEKALKHTDVRNAKLVSNWISVELLALLNKYDLDILASPISAADLGMLINRIADQTISGKIAKQVFELMWDSGKDPDTLIKQHNLVQVTDIKLIETLVDQVIDRHPAQVAEYKSGKEKVFGFFVGQIMKESKGKANPDLVNQLLRSKL